MRKAIGAILFTVVVLVVSGTIHALPNVVGSTFINPAKMRFEEFGVMKVTYEPNAKLLADWELWTDETVKANTEVLKLKQRAIVFGIEAKSVVVHRLDNKVQQFKVQFAPNEKLNTPEKLAGALKTNSGLWADGDWKGDTIEHKAATLTIGANADGPTVTFVPKQ